MAGNGCDDAELREAQTRLGFSLPASTRTAYELIGRRRDLTSVPDRLEVVEIGRMLVFRWECHHVVEWGVPLSAVAEPDPPVAFRPGGGTVTWFETSGAIAREDPGTWLWVGAASPDGIAAVQRALPGEWSRNDE